MRAHRVINPRARRAGRMARGAAPLVGIIMGSSSDGPVMAAAADTLDSFGVAHEDQVVSAHRTPSRLAEYARHAEGAGIRVIVAGAGGAAHLPGMMASHTLIPVVLRKRLAAHRLEQHRSVVRESEKMRKSGLRAQARLRRAR